MRNALSIILIFVGILVIFVSLFIIYRRNDPDRLSFKINQEVTENSAESEEETPSILNIRELGIAVPVIPAHLNINKWEVTSEGVSYLVDTPLPGEKGNAIFYGHNWGSILGNLTRAMPGQRVEVVFTNGRIIEFEISLVQEVTPDETSILNQTSDTRLTIYTCSGFLDQKRFVVTAIPISEVAEST